MGCSEFSFLKSTCTQVDSGKFFSIQISPKAGNAIDLTGSVLVMTIKDDDGNTILNLPIVGDDATTGLFIPIPSNGIFFIQIIESDSLPVADGTYKQEIIITSDGRDEIFMVGLIEFKNRSI